MKFPPSFLAGLEAQFRDPDPEQRCIAASFLQNQPGPELSELLGKALMAEKDRGVQIVLIETLVRRRDASAEMWLRQIALDHADTEVRKLVMLGIAKMKLVPESGGYSGPVE